MHKQPTVKERILSFFKGAESDYKSYEKLTGTTKRLYKQYKKLFDEYSERNFGNNSMEIGNYTKTTDVKLDLADDYYQIASDSVYNYSKKETGKVSSTHSGVKEWHYFVNDIYFAEQNSDKYEPYTVTINVKEKENGAFVYSFSAEKNKNETITPRTLHAAVKGTESSPDNHLVNTSIPQNAEKINPSDESFYKYIPKEFLQGTSDGDIHSDYSYESLAKKTDMTITEVTEALPRDTEGNSNEKITVEMSDSERTEILRNKEISAPIYRGEADASIESNIADIESKKRTVVENALIRIADEFNAKGDYKIEDVELEVSFSNKSIRESSNKSITDPKKLAKLLPILSDSVKKAIGIETHDNRYYYDNITKRFHELVGGYIDGDSFVPVRFGVKELNDGSCILYVVICQEKIKTEVLGIQAAEKSASHTPRPVNISIAQIAKNVNSQNKDLLRYFPNGLLNEEQRKAKNEAIAETVEYTNAKNDKCSKVGEC